MVREKIFIDNGVLYFESMRRIPVHRIPAIAPGGEIPCDTQNSCQLDRENTFERAQAALLREDFTTAACWYRVNALLQCCCHPLPRSAPVSLSRPP